MNRHHELGHGSVQCCVPAGHPAESLRGSFLPKACQDDERAESPESRCRCPLPGTEPSGPHVEPVLPLCDRTAAGDPKHSIYNFPMSMAK